jgi:hypothetical protein
MWLESTLNGDVLIHALGQGKWQATIAHPVCHVVGNVAVSAPHLWWLGFLLQ